MTMLPDSPLSAQITDAGLVMDNDCDCVMCLYILYPDNDGGHYLCADHIIPIYGHITTSAITRQMPHHNNSLLCSDESQFVI